MGERRSPCKPSCGGELLAAVCAFRADFFDRLAAIDARRCASKVRSSNTTTQLLSEGFSLAR